MNTAATGILALSLLALTSANDRVARGDEVPASDSRLRVIQQELKMLPKLIPSLQTHRRIGFHGHAAELAWVIVDFDREVTPEKIVLFPARPAIAGDPPSAGFPSSFQIDISSDKGFSTSVHVARWQEEAVGAGERIDFLSFKGNGTSGRFLRILVTGFRDDPLQPGRQYYRLGEVVVLERGQNVALSCPVTSTGSTEISRRWEARNLTDGYFWCLPLRGPESSPTNGYRSEIAGRAVVSDDVWVEVDLGVFQPIDEVHLVTAYPRDFADQPGFGFPTHFRVLADADTADETEILIILDIGLPGMSGLEGLSKYKDLSPATDIIMFTVFDDRQRVFEAICAGASGYLLKSEPLERIVAAVEEVTAGGAPMTPEIARSVLNRFSQLAPSKTDSDLSDREREVLTLLADGLTKKEIAVRLDLSPHTVDNYVRRIYAKLHVNTVGGAVAKALREGLV